MATNQDKLDYAVSAGFKRDIFAGTDKVEKEGRATFFRELLDYRVVQGDPKAGNTNSLAQFLQWNASGINTIFARLVSVDAKTDALAAAVAGLAKALPGGESLDVDKLLQSIEDRVAAGMTTGLATLSADVTLTLDHTKAV